MNFNADKLYRFVKDEVGVGDILYESQIIRLVGMIGLQTLVEHGYLQSCGILNGQRIYQLIEKE